MIKTLLSSFATLFVAIGCYAQLFNGPLQIDSDPGFDPYEIASGDLDGDGDIDIAIATFNITGPTPRVDNIKWYKNDGSGTFTVETVVSSSLTQIDGLIVANLDNQFGLDIVATSVSQGKLVYFLSDGTGFGAEVVVDDTLIDPGQVVAGDINKDGHIDLATMSFTNNAMYWYAGDGAASFTKQPVIGDNSILGPYYMDLGDIDGDNDLDVIVGFFDDNGTADVSDDTQPIEIYYNQYTESGTMMSVSWIKDAVTVDDDHTFLFSIALGDVNNDGALNIIKADNSSGEVSWYSTIKNTSSTENNIASSTLIPRPGAVAVFDINNDGFEDVIVANSNSTSPGIIWFEGSDNSAPSTTAVTIVTNSRQFFDLSADDFDGDTDIDIATVGRSSDTVDWYQNLLNPLSVEGQGLNDLRFYPNPTNERLFIESSFDRHLEVSILDTLGKVVLETSMSSNDSIDVSQLGNGLYILKFKNFDTTLKFIKG